MDVLRTLLSGPSLGTASILDQKHFEEHPSFYFRRQVYATFMEDPVGLRERHQIGVDKIMWSSDYPHSETTWPRSKELTEDWFKDFDAHDRAQICADNARRLYNL